MYKILTAFSLYWHFILDTLLTHIFVIAFLNAGFSLVAAILMSTDAILKVGLSVYISRFVARFPLSVRGRASVILRLILIGIWFLAVSQLLFKNISFFIFIPFMVFKLMMVVDSSLSAEFVFLLREYFRIDLTQSAAAQNILARASTAVAPAAAITMLYLPYTIVIIFIIAIVIGISCTFFLRKIFFSPSTNIFSFSHERSFLLADLLANPLMRWGLLFQVVGNLAFAGVAFLLLAELKINEHIFLNEITALYLAFLLAQGAALIFGEKIVPASKCVHVGYMMVVCGLFVFGASIIHPGLARLVICGGIGMCYSFMLSAIQKVVTTHLRGPGFIEYAGWAQTLGRFISFLSTSTLGMCMSVSFSASTLLMICGLIGIFGALLFVRVNIS